MKDLGPRDWVEEKLRTIKLVLSCQKKPFELIVRKFRPIDGDINQKHWIDSKGNKQTIELEPFALASIWKTASAYVSYVFNYANEALDEYSENPNVDPIVRATYKAA